MRWFIVKSFGGHFGPSPKFDQPKFSLKLTSVLHMQNLNFIKLLETATELILRGVIVHGGTDGKTDWHDLT